MPQHKHFFISYGRKESLAFAGRLHQWLALHGHEAWFDKVNIPSGDDYQERINAGIRDAQNFLFVMAPHSLTSPYCYAELEYALSLGKRIFPVMHIEETAEQQAQYTAAQTAVRGKAFAVVGKRDWLMARERLGNLDELRAWQTSYENSWPKHEEKDYLGNWECPIAWESIDKLEEAAAKLVKMAHRHARHVEQHTELLNLAYEWDREGRPTNGVLVGHGRTEAEHWLTAEFRGELPPCQAIPLQAQYIVASKKNAQGLMTEAFLCYATPDKALTVSVKNALEMRGVSTWLHFHDIERAQDYLPRIYQGIEQADNVLFFLSEASLSSEWCLKELQHAISLNKRIIPLKVGKLDAAHRIAPRNGQEAIDRLLTLQYIDLTDNEEGRIDEVGKTDFERDIDDIAREMARDEEYYGQHKMLLSQAIRWEKDPSAAYLLRGHNLENALAWLRQHRKRGEHAPTALHERFIKESEQQRGLHPSELFVSYSRKDGDFARQLNRRLQAEGRITWFDQESIASGVDFDQAIFEGIEQADNFLFIISPASVASDFCKDELEHAANLGKRYIPILLAESDEYAAKLPEAYANTQWIDFAGKGFEKGVQDLLILLDTDREHVRGHAEWQRRALEWAQAGKSEDYLLNASALNKARAWLANAGMRVPEKPLALLQEEREQQAKALAKAQSRNAGWKGMIPMVTKQGLACYGLLLLLFLCWNLAFGALVPSKPFKWGQAVIAGAFTALWLLSMQGLYRFDHITLPPQPVGLPFWKKAGRLMLHLLGLVLAYGIGYIALMFLYETALSRSISNTLDSLLFGMGAVLPLHSALAYWNSRRRQQGQGIQVEDEALEGGKEPRPTLLQADLLGSSAWHLFLAARKDLKARRVLQGLLGASVSVLSVALYLGYLSYLRGEEAAIALAEVRKSEIRALSDTTYFHDLKSKYFPELLNIKGGIFDMGSGEGEEHERPVHAVRVSDYRISNSEVTVDQYLAFCEASGYPKPARHGRWTKDRRRFPIVEVSWYDAIAYCNWLSEAEGLAPAYRIAENGKGRRSVEWLPGSNGYRLPTEAEWEYAARGGQEDQGKYRYSGSDEAKEVAVAMYDVNSSIGSHSVGSKKANGLGLYDMSGNVWEWCWDWYGDYEGGRFEDPKGPAEGSRRVCRGGSYSNAVWDARVSRRNGGSPESSDFRTGFRVAADGLRPAP